MGISLGVAILGIALLLGPRLLDDGGTTLPSKQPGATTLNPAPRVTEESGATTLLPAPPGTKVPINEVDPVTGKPITPSSPMKTHKRYVIAFCCAKSAGYTGWDWISEAEKDALVRRYLK